MYTAVICAACAAVRTRGAAKKAQVSWPDPDRPYPEDHATLSAVSVLTLTLTSLPICHCRKVRVLRLIYLSVAK